MPLPPALTPQVLACIRDHACWSTMRARQNDCSWQVDPRSHVPWQVDPRSHVGPHTAAHDGTHGGTHDGAHDGANDGAHGGAGADMDETPPVANGNFY